MKNYDAIIIGFGKAGKTLAGYLGGLGKKVALIEKSKDMYGGTCINEGCIPSKSLIVQSKYCEYKQAIENKEKLIQTLREKNYQKINQFASVDIIDGEARFINNHEIKVNDDILRGEHIFINTGSETIIPHIQGIENTQNVYTSKTIMKKTKLPSRLAIIGGGYIGLEFASMYAQYGSQVTVFEFYERLLPREDDDIASTIENMLKQQGISFSFHSQVQQLKNKESLVQMTFIKDEKEYCEEFDAVLLATGRRPQTKDLGLENTEILVNDKGEIVVNEYLQTTVPHVYAMGDVKGGLQFTYISLDDFRIVKDHLYGKQERTTHNRGWIPYSVFITPTFSRVGLSEKEALEQGYKIKVSKLPVSTIPRALVDNKSEGLLKAIIDQETDHILGCILICEHSEEMINFVQLAMNQNMTAQELAQHIFTHPSFSEAMNDLFTIS